MALTPCEWPTGCLRPKERGKGARYCAPHRRVAVAQDKRRNRGPAADHHVGQRAVAKARDEYNAEQEARYTQELRATLRAFGLK